MSLLSTAISPYRLYAEIAGAVILIGLSTGWYFEHNHKEQMIGAEECLAKQQEQATKDQKQGAQAVKEALAKMEDENRKQSAIREQAAKDELQRTKNDADRAHAKASDLERRYQLQLTQSKSCADWSKEISPCPMQ